MLWKVIAIKQIKGQQDSKGINNEFIIEGTEEKQIRKILQPYGIVIVSLEKFLGDPQTFGTTRVYVQIDTNTQKTFVTKKQPQEAVNDFLASGFDVISCSSPTITSQEQIKQIIQEGKKYSAALQQDNALVEIQKKAKQKKIYNNEKQQKIITIVQETLQDIKKMKETELSGVSHSNVVILQELEAELKMVKMASNTEKITNVLEKVLGLMETIEHEHLIFLKEQEKTVILDSSVSNVDVQGELTKFKKAQVVQKAGTSKTSNDTYYSLFGKWGIYQKFVQKDILTGFANINHILHDMINIVTFVVILLLSSLGIALFFDHIAGNQFNGSLLLSSIHLGSLGMGIALSFIATSKNVLITISQIVLAVFLYFVISTLIIINFALV